MPASPEHPPLYLRATSGWPSALIRLIVPLFALIALGPGRAQSQRPASARPANAAHRDDARSAPLAARIAAVSEHYLGTAYVADPLGEGAGNEPDVDPLMDRRHVDCVTFVEQVLAEAVAPAPEAMLPTLLRLRYRKGHVGIASRNHFFVADWLPQNRWLVADVTEAVGGAAVRRMTKTIDRASLLRARGASPAVCRVAPERLTMTYIPRAAVPALLGRMPRVAIAVFMTSRPGLCAAHTGLLLARAGKCVLRHASQRQQRVVEEPLLSYLQRAPARIVGLKVCAIHAPQP